MIALIVIISVSVHNAKEDARLTAQIKANADAVTSFSEQVKASVSESSENVIVATNAPTQSPMQIPTQTPILSPMPEPTYVSALGEKNALSSAKNYISIMAFSYIGLGKQLMYEGYTYNEAKYAVDNCGADWFEQAAKKAASYLEMMSFSREDLIEQLEYEEFTHEQAEYAVTQVGY